MAKSKKQKELDKELREECWGYSERDNKPDGAYIKAKGIFFNLNKIKRLIEMGADVNAKNGYGYSPLRLAVRGDNKLIKLLISAGADVNTKDYRGESPLHIAILNENIALVKLLISAGADVNAKDKYSKSPLRRAVDKNNKAIAKLLIKAGVDVIESLFD